MSTFLEPRAFAARALRARRLSARSRGCWKTAWTRRKDPRLRGDDENWRGDDENWRGDDENWRGQGGCKQGDASPAFVKLSMIS